MYDKLKDRLHDELEKIEHKADLSAGDLETAHKLTDTIKNIDKICMLEDEGYSEMVDDDRHMSRGRSGTMTWRNDGYSGRRRRDSMGRYSRGDGRTAMMEHLEAAMDAASEQDRENIKRFMRQFDND